MKWEIEVAGTDKVLAALDRIEKYLMQIEKNTRSTAQGTSVPDYSEEMEEMAVNLDELAQQVEQNTTVTEAVEQVLNRVADAASEAGVSQDQIDAFSNQLRENSGRIAAAVQRVADNMPHPDQTLPGDLPQQ